MPEVIVKTDELGRLTLPPEYASCEVVVERRGESLVVSKVGAKRYRLKDLLAGITPENSHGEISTGRPVGNEML